MTTSIPASVCSVVRRCSACVSSRPASSSRPTARRAGASRRSTPTTAIGSRSWPAPVPTKASTPCRPRRSCGRCSTPWPTRCPAAHPRPPVVRPGRVRAAQALAEGSTTGSRTGCKRASPGTARSLPRQTDPSWCVSHYASRPTRKSSPPAPSASSCRCTTSRTHSICAMRPCSSPSRAPARATGSASERAPTRASRCALPPTRGPCSTGSSPFGCPTRSRSRPTSW